MAAPHPYAPSTNRLIEVINHLRREGLPKKFSYRTLIKAKVPLSYTGRLINALQFVGVIDEAGKHNPDTASIFAGDDRKFANGFATMVERSYSSLFNKSGNSAWTLDIESLVKFFSETDKKASVIAKMQAKTFLAFASLSSKPSPTAKETSEVEQDSTKRKFVDAFAKFFDENEDTLLERPHQFEERDIHPKIEEKCKKIFDDGHYSHTTFEACKLLEERVRELANSDKIGTRLMTDVFSVNNPILLLSNLSGQNQENEQQGFMDLFRGIIAGIKNPRSHKAGINENIDQCLDHLSLVSMLMRKLDDRPR